MRNAWIGISAAVWLALGAGAARAAVIYQAFNQPFSSLHGQLEQLAHQGYEFIQLSPPQKSIDNPIWWGRYQPVDFSVIDGPLGNEGDLHRLITHAHELGLKVIIDVVLNHMADPTLYHNHGLQYPQFSARDFHYPDTGPCISDWSNRWQVTNFWLCGDPEHPERKLPDLDTSSAYVRGVHKRFLQKLVDLGADGFRFDAVKHMEPEYFADLVRFVPTRLFYYGEVIGETLGESHLYTPYMRVTDFHLLRLLLQVFAWGGDVRYLVHPEGFGAALPGSASVVFSRNHDTVNNPNFFAFGTYSDAVLANAYVIARGVGSALVYRDDAEDSTVAAAVGFHRHMDGEATYVRRAEDVCASYSDQCAPQELLFIERGSRGLAIINKSTQWVAPPQADMPGLGAGCYRELRYGFTMQVAADHKITSWAGQAQRGFEIGPRTALFFVPTACR